MVKALKELSLHPRVGDPNLLVFWYLFLSLGFHKIVKFLLKFSIVNLLVSVKTMPFIHLKIMYLLYLLVFMYL